MPAAVAGKVGIELGRQIAAKPPAATQGTVLASWESLDQTRTGALQTGLKYCFLGNPIGTAVTLRGARMYHFLDRFINTALPRIRDFRGLPRTGFDGRGNFSIGIREQIIFPEIDYNQIDRIRGLQVTIATSARNDEEGIRLLELYGMPFIRLT